MHVEPSGFGLPGEGRLPSPSPGRGGGWVASRIFAAGGDPPTPAPSLYSGRGVLAAGL